MNHITIGFRDSTPLLEGLNCWGNMRTRIYIYFSNH